MRRLHHGSAQIYTRCQRITPAFAFQAEAHLVRRLVNLSTHGTHCGFQLAAFNEKPNQMHNKNYFRTKRRNVLLHSVVKWLQNLTAVSSSMLFYQSTLQQKPGITSETQSKTHFPSSCLKLAVNPTRLTSSINTRHDCFLSIWRLPASQIWFFRPCAHYLSK